MAIRALTTDDADVYRAVRLRALATDPDAFATTHAVAASYDAARWRERLAGFAGRPGQIFVADDPGADHSATAAPVAGMVGVGESEEPGDCVLWGMWVAPEHRGTGVGRRLLDAAIGWARARGAASVTLWVMRANAAARDLYVRYGFEEHPEGARGAPDECVDEPCFRLRLPSLGGER